MKNNVFNNNPPIIQVIRTLLSDLKMESESCVKHLKENSNCKTCSGYEPCKKACFLLESYTLWGNCVDALRLEPQGPHAKLFKDLASFCTTGAALLLETQHSEKSEGVNIRKLFESLN